MNVSEALRSRRSVRYFGKQEVNYYVDCGRLTVREDSGGVSFSYKRYFIFFRFLEAPTVCEDIGSIC